MKIYLVEWIEDEQTGKAVVKASHLMEAVQKVQESKGLVNGNMTLAGEIENDVHIVKDTGIPF